MELVAKSIYNKVSRIALQRATVGEFIIIFFIIIGISVIRHQECSFTRGTILCNLRPMSGDKK